MLPKFAGSKVTTGSTGSSSLIAYTGRSVDEPPPQQMCLSQPQFWSQGELNRDGSMLYYPKISGSQAAPLKQCIAFEKYDGTNLHWNWNRELGWHSFGTRRDQFEMENEGIDVFCARHPQLAQAPDVFQESLAGGIGAILREHAAYQAVTNVRVFAEFLGPGSFAGLHRDFEPKELRLFDVWLDPFGFVGPAQFVRDFRELNAARVVYRGKLTGRFAEDVRQGRYGVNEGVVCKGGSGGPDVWMAKIKTNAYLARLKEAFADRWEEHWE